MIEAAMFLVLTVNIGAENRIRDLPVCTRSLR
jgi:hypothetical protein